MTVKRFLIVPAVFLLLAIGYAALLFAPKNNGMPYRLVVEKGQGMAAVKAVYIGNGFFIFRAQIQFQIGKAD